MQTVENVSWQVQKFYVDSICLSVSEINEKTNCLFKGANAYLTSSVWAGEATSPQIKTEIKNVFVWENEGHITKDHKKMCL